MPSAKIPGVFVVRYRRLCGAKAIHTWCIPSTAWVLYSVSSCLMWCQSCLLTFVCSVSCAYITYSLFRILPLEFRRRTCFWQKLIQFNWQMIMQHRTTFQETYMTFKIYQNTNHTVITVEVHAVTTPVPNPAWWARWWNHLSNWTRSTINIWRVNVIFWTGLPLRAPLAGATRRKTTTFDPWCSAGRVANQLGECHALQSVWVCEWIWMSVNEWVFGLRA